MLWTIGLCLFCFVMGLAVQRHNRHDEACNAFADSVIGLVAIPLSVLKSKVSPKSSEETTVSKPHIVEETKKSA